MVELSKKAGVNPGLLLAAALLVSSIIILVCFGASILTVVITVVYPAVQSIKALETTDRDDDDKTWLTYWIIFGIFTLLDEFGWFILNFIPLYFWLRILFFVFLMAPQTRGAETIYRTFVKPILIQHKDKIQKFIEEIKGSAGEAVNEAKNEAKKQLNDPTNIMKAA